MSHYETVEAGLQALLRSYAAVSEKQAGRIAMLCVGILLAKDIGMSWIARQLKRAGQQASRIRWIERMLQTNYLTPQLVYQPMLQHALQAHGGREWHLIMDRTAFITGIDLVTIALYYRKRAIPLIWCEVKAGGADHQVYCQLVKACAALIPAHVTVIFHGDTEFSSGQMIRTLYGLRWQFILAQSGNWTFRQRQADKMQAFNTLKVPQRGTLMLPDIELYHSERLGGLHLVAFRQMRRIGKRVKRTHCYLVTSLRHPLRCIRRLGRHRWGIEPFHKDYKSSGFGLNETELRSSQRRARLLTLLAVCYLWCVCLGRWLTKTGQRYRIDRKPKRQYSYFRIGWDWLVHALRCHQPLPVVLRLYT
jgi:hypothetical protein